MIITIRPYVYFHVYSICKRCIEKAYGLGIFLTILVPTPAHPKYIFRCVLSV